MKKKAISLFLALVMCFTLLPTAALAENTAVGNEITLYFTGDCATERTETVDLKDYLPEDAVVTGISSVLPNVVSSFTREYSTIDSANVETARFSYVTRKLDEPANGILTVTVSTSNHGNYVFTINITLTGKYLVTLSAIPQNALYDGQGHRGYSNLNGTLTSGDAYIGDYAFTYAEKDGTPLTDTPSEVGDYTVTISIPNDNANYKHKEALTLAFSIIANAEAQYQTEADGMWLNGAFDQALANVYAGGTIKLLKDVVLTHTATLAKKMIITSADASAPCTITSNINEHGYLLNITSEVRLENITVDGGSQNSITAKRAAIAVNGGKLTIGSGAVVQHNNNVTTAGVGGGICVISGALTVHGGKISGNQAYWGGGVGMVGGTFYAQSGIITGNTARMGGGISVWESGSSAGTLYISGTVSVTGNAATSYAGGIQYSNAGKIYLSGSPTINQNTSSEETNGGIYLDGNPTNGFAIVKVDAKLSSDASVSFYSWKGSDGFVLAESADGYTITADDVGAMLYDSNLGIKLTDENKVVLTDVGVYQITFDANGGSCKTEKTNTAESKLLSLPVPTRSGYTFAGWFTAADGGEQITSDTVFEQNTALYAHWIYNLPPNIQYNITVNSTSHGTVFSSAKSATQGTAVTLTAKPDNGYNLETLTVTANDGAELELSDNGNGKYTFKMPGSRVTVTATFTAKQTTPVRFIDVPSDSYYFDAVLWAINNGVTDGIDDAHFAPDLPCTRAQIVTFLWRAANSPAAADTNSFADVSPTAYYAKAVAWAMENGIAIGVTSDTFCPDMTCTRAQAAAFLFRYAISRGTDAVAEQELVNSYSDAALVPEYSLPAFNWALSTGVIQGDNGKLMPGNDCTRAQIVTMLHRYFNNSK